MNFKPSSALRREPSLSDRVPPVAVVPKPVIPRPVDANAGLPSGTSGAAAYAPPNIRKSVKPADQGKLKAALDDLIDARAMIDRVLNEKRD